MRNTYARVLLTAEGKQGELRDGIRGLEKLSEQKGGGKGKPNIAIQTFGAPGGIKEDLACGGPDLEGQ